jgi:hypothetical protein
MQGENKKRGEARSEKEEKEERRRTRTKFVGEIQAKKISCYCSVRITASVFNDFEQYLRDRQGKEGKASEG